VAARESLSCSHLERELSVCEKSLSIFRAALVRAGSKEFLLFRAEKILPITILLDGSGLNFRVGLGSGPDLGGLYAHFIV
jgi:hypothetical protein